MHKSKSNYQKIFHLALFEKNHFLRKYVAYATQCRVCNTQMSHMQHRVAYATHMCRICNAMLHMRHAFVAYATACCARDMCKGEGDKFETNLHLFSQVNYIITTIARPEYTHSSPPPPFSSPSLASKVTKKIAKQR